MDLTTVARVKTFLSLRSAKHDPLIAKLISGVSVEAERLMGRHALQTARTEQYNIERGQSIVFLRGYPVASAPAAAFKNDYARDFTGSAIDAKNYYLDLDRGKVSFDMISLSWGPGVFQAAYTGGMATTTDSFIQNFVDVADAVDIQVAFLFKRRDTLGLAGYSSDGGNVSFEKLVEFIEPARKAILRHRRTGLVYQ